jgi:hypothetical protein
VPWAATGSTVAAAAVETAPTADGRTGHFRTSLRCSATVFFVLCAGEANLVGNVRKSGVSAGTSTPSSL